MLRKRFQRPSFFAFSLSSAMTGMTVFQRVAGSVGICACATRTAGYTSFCFARTSKNDEGRYQNIAYVWVQRYGRVPQGKRRVSQESPSRTGRACPRSVRKERCVRSLSQTVRNTRSTYQRPRGRRGVLDNRVGGHGRRGDSREKLWGRGAPCPALTRGK